MAPDGDRGSPPIIAGCCKIETPEAAPVHRSSETSRLGASISPESSATAIVSGIAKHCPMIPSCGGLFDGYFVWEKKRGATIVELHQEHAPTKIIQLTQDNWLLIEAGTTLLVSNRTK
jgi:hypothetical protein